MAVGHVEAHDIGHGIRQGPVSARELGRFGLLAEGGDERRQLGAQQGGELVDRGRVAVGLGEPRDARRRVRGAGRLVDRVETEAVRALRDDEEPLALQGGRLGQQRAAADRVQRPDRVVADLVALTDRHDPEDRRSFVLAVEQVAEQLDVPRLEDLQG